MEKTKMALEEFWALDSGTKWDVEIEYKEKTFTACICEGEKLIWSCNNSMAVPLNDISTLEQLKDRLDVYVNGNYICIRCGKILNPKDRESYNSFWAGIYCNDCWTEKDQEEKNWAYSHLD